MEYLSQTNSDFLFNNLNFAYFIRSKSENGSINIPIYGMSPQGLELSNFVEKKINADYLRLFAKYLEENGGFELHCSQIIERPEDGVEFKNQTKIEPSELEIE